MTVYAAMLALGRGMDQDFDEAAVWFRQAAVRDRPTFYRGLAQSIGDRQTLFA